MLASPASAEGLQTCSPAHLASKRAEGQTLLVKAASWIQALGIGVEQDPAEGLEALFDCYLL